MDPFAQSSVIGNDYVAALDAEDYANAKNLAKSAVEIYKNLLLDVTAEESVLNSALYHAMLFRSLLDYAELAELTSGEQWEGEPKSLELVWRKMCDCRERIDFVGRVAAGNVLTRIKSRLDRIETFYTNRFGSGLYSSPEIFVKRERCSICNNDLRGCEHIPSHVYRGRICYGVSEGISLRSSSIVQVPHDRRCRIWPWQIEGNKLSGIILLTVFRLDDFMNDPGE